jgi:hypothetical protein
LFCFFTNFLDFKSTEEELSKTSQFNYFQMYCLKYSMAHPRKFINYHPLNAVYPSPFAPMFPDFPAPDNNSDLWLPPQRLPFMPNQPPTYPGPGGGGQSFSKDTFF